MKVKVMKARDYHGFPSNMKSETMEFSTVEDLFDFSRKIDKPLVINLDIGDHENVSEENNIVIYDDYIE